MTTTKTICEIWNLRNQKSFGSEVDTKNVGNRIIDTIVYRGWNNKKLRKYVATLMIEE